VALDPLVSSKSNTREHRTRDEEVERLLALSAAMVADHRRTRPGGRCWPIRRL
jgi:hypothetical protein